MGTGEGDTSYTPSHDHSRYALTMGEDTGCGA